ncbi:MAG: acyl-ACP desaturase [Gemmataceae bacterium]|jgi:acyl-[acyl-carrier-protein] desaturase|nr:acyl-ACP desaturase [Gemmataceae bacterium]
MVIQANPPEPPPEVIEDPELREKIYKVFRDYFKKAEKKRRWNIDTDIPWDQVNKDVDPVVADVIETFCMVELYLPDYLAKQLPAVRANRGRAWMLANWGYEESKHSMVLEDWLIRSGHRTEKQVREMGDDLFSREWNVHYGNSRSAVIYTMFQELATRLHYRNLRAIAAGRDPALDKILELVMQDEAAHAHFFRSLVQLYLEYDRERTIEHFRHVVRTFHMPADSLLAQGRQRMANIRALKIFDESIYFTEVYQPLVQVLGLTKDELKPKKVHRVS